MLALLALAIGLNAAAAQEKSITVFAAASMKNALDDVDAAFTRKTGIKVVASYDASSALMKQIKDDTRINLLGNQLVLIAPKDSKIDHVDIKSGFDIAKLAGDGRIATGDVKAVPVGIYAQAALQKLGAWAAAEPKMALTQNVRAALVLVARGEVPLGIVYSTDAKVEPGVKVVAVFPDDSHDPIVYPVAATTHASPEAMPYLDYLHSQAAKSIFETYGFSFLVKPTS